MTAIDKDFRFMAVSDFHNVLATGNYTSDGDQDLRVSSSCIRLLSVIYCHRHTPSSVPYP